MAKTISRVLENVTCSFVYVFKPAASIDPNIEPQYSMDILYKKDDKRTHALVVKALIEAAQADPAKLGFKSAEQIDAKAVLASKNPIKDGDARTKPIDLYKGCYYLTVKSKEKPQVIDAKGTLLTSEIDFYSGCIAHVAISFRAYGPPEIKLNKGIGAYLNSVLKVADGMRLSGTKTAHEAFSSYLNNDAPADDVDDLV